MAGKSFKSTKGKADSGKINYMELKNGKNRFRLFGDVLPMYTYWVRSVNGEKKNMPVECLEFDREAEEFKKGAKDPVRDLDLRDTKDPKKKIMCGWSYKMQGINLATGEVQVIPLKKKFFAKIQSLAEDLGRDPTCPDEGFDIVLEREKTGPHAYNVEYNVRDMLCKPRVCTDEEKEAIAKAQDIEELFPIPSYDDHMEYVKRIITPQSATENEDSAGNENKMADDIEHELEN